MIVPDVNLLVYAANHDATHHERARVWLEQTLSGTEPVGLPWLVTVAFVRLTTHARVFSSPLTTDQALGFVNSWLAQPCTEPLNPGDRHWLILADLLRESGSAGNLTNDAHLAALAIEHNACLHSADTDFLRFAGLKHHNPLSQSSLQEARAVY